MAELELIPVHTKILTNKDNIVDAILEYAGKDITSRDIVCTAESVLAITQNRYVRPEELNVCWQARLMNRFVPGAGSMASIYGMQAAMEEEVNGICFIHLLSVPFQKLWENREFFMPVADRHLLLTMLPGQCRLLISVLSMVLPMRTGFVKI